MEQQNKTHFLDGRFIVLSRLGDGGSASVWRVLDTKYDVERAIKILHISGGPTTLQRFEQEVIIMMQLNSANIVTVYESFVEEDQLHVVMEKCTGSLNTWSQMHGRMPPRLAVKVVIEILKGLEKAHNKGVVHRDIKPHNILIDEDGGVKIADFGLALFYLSPESLTKTGALLGSLAFMSPEQRLNPTDVSPATDIYSTTMTLAWLLENQSVPDLYLPETIEDLRSRHAATLVDVMDRGGRHKPADRYASAKEMKEALKVVESTLPDTEHSLLGLQLVEVSIEDLMPSPSQPVITENQSMELKALNSVRWMLVVVVLLLVGIAGAVIWQLQGRDVETRSTVAETELDVPMCSTPIRSFTRLTKVGPQESVQTAFEDLNQDGRTDAIFVNQYSQTISIYWGNEAYEMQEPLEMEYARSRSRPIVADFNRDGQLDMVSSHIDLQRIQIHHRLGDTEWRTPSEDDESILLQIPPPRGGMAYDGNGDGHLDLYLVAQNIADVTYQILVRTAKPEGSFNNHEVLTSMPTNPVMDAQYPNVYWLEEGALFHKDVLKLSQAPTLLAEGLTDLKVQQAIRNRTGDVEVMMLDAQGTIYRWSELEGVCQLSENALGQNDTMYEESFGYWNDDDIIDIATTRTCMYCTSNHMLLLGN